MKKLLSLVLAVIMLLSIMPMAYAERATYSPEIEEYIEDYIKAYAYVNSVYEPREQNLEVNDIILEAIGENTAIFPKYENLINIEADGRLEEITASHECFKKGIDEVEKKIADGELVVVINFYEFWKCFWYLECCYYSSKDYMELNDRVKNLKSDKYIEAEIAIDTVYEILRREDNTYTQAEFDAAMEIIKPFFNSCCACLDGNHPYGEYISDNNATEEADGTKTATCEFCGATDTITDEGTKLPKEKATLLEMIFDLIQDFFDLIFSMFK